MNSCVYAPIQSSGHSSETLFALCFYSLQYINDVALSLLELHCRHWALYIHSNNKPLRVASPIQYEKWKVFPVQTRSPHAFFMCCHLCDHALFLMFCTSRDSFTEYTSPGIVTHCSQFTQSPYLWHSNSKWLHVYVHLKQKVWLFFKLWTFSINIWRWL